MFAGISIRNFYGLWHADNPHTEAEDVEITDGIITDARHPDNFSGRIMGRVKEELKKLYPQTVEAVLAALPEERRKKIEARSQELMRAMPESGLVRKNQGSLVRLTRSSRVRDPKLTYFVVNLLHSVP
jgi:hypothetical protein